MKITIEIVNGQIQVHATTGDRLAILCALELAKSVFLQQPSGLSSHVRVPPPDMARHLVTSPNSNGRP